LGPDLIEEKTMNRFILILALGLWFTGEQVLARDITDDPASKDSIRSAAETLKLELIRAQNDIVERARKIESIRGAMRRATYSGGQYLLHLTPAILFDVLGVLFLSLPLVEVLESTQATASTLAGTGFLVAGAFLHSRIFYNLELTAAQYEGLNSQLGLLEDELVKRKEFVARIHAALRRGQE
jgi:hypothetical protein